MARHDPGRSPAPFASVTYLRCRRRQSARGVDTAGRDHQRGVDVRSADMVAATFRRGRMVVTTKNDFTEEEWVRVRRAPFVAGMAISLADPGGPFEMAKETMATIKSATNPPSREQMLADVALDIQSMTQQKQNPLSDFKPIAGATAGQQVLDELRAVQGIVSTKATPEETSAFGQWLFATAQAAADAAKEGGFMGFGATQVSQGEKDMLDQVRATLGI
jgi:hypothetical protein